MENLAYSTLIGSLVVAIFGLLAIAVLLHFENQRLRKVTEEQQKVLDGLRHSFLKKEPGHWEA